MTVAVSFKDVSFSTFLHAFCCDVDAGDMVLLVTAGEEESSVISRLMTGMTAPDHGSVMCCEQELSGLSPDRLRELRQGITVVPSAGGLISNLKLWENITLPKSYHHGMTDEADLDTAQMFLKELGYSGSLIASPSQLSMYEKRAVAFVRAVIQKPDTIIYSHCFDGIPRSSRTLFARLASDFHRQLDSRTSICLSSSRDLAEDIQFDTVISTHDAGSSRRGIHNAQ